ncbi:MULTISPECIES: DNA-processing protein DprA [unclassified Synechococcus]|uniref:DNA-processing protein DprA n=1 Tax=unclassified Synechococcus TaxID=2626047 RepID=UPI0039C4B24D
MSFPLSPSDPVGKREPSRGPGHEERERPYWLAWARIKGIGPHRLKRLAEFFGSLERAWQADAPALRQVEGIGPTLAQAIVSARPGLDPEQILEETLKAGIPFLTPADPDYPPLLWEVPDPPPILYALGECPNWQQPAIAIVGTRAPTAYGRQWTQKVSAALAEAGCVVVSGLATGIDGIAHQACLDAGGKTVAVVGTGVDKVYPAHHQALYRRILAQGAILSEYPPGTPPAKEHFPQRNRIIAGLCRATLVMEAPETSGALITAHLANHYGREVYALPGNIDTAAARGCLHLIRSGAGMILGIEELLKDLGLLQGSPVLKQPSSTGPSDPQQQLLWQLLGEGILSLDALAQASQMDIATLSSTLLLMELEGWLVQLPGMRYQRAR